jgi:hypothetical protein
VSELLVVAAERHVELASREGIRAETRRRLSERLAAVLLQSTRFAAAATARAALAAVLPNALEGDRAAARLRTRAEAWERTVDAFDDAIGELRRHGVTAAALGVIEDDEPIARLLRRAMNALDARLEKAGLVDERLRFDRLAAVIARAPAEDVARIVGASRVRARHVLRWDWCDAVWWRELQTALARTSGGAHVELPIVAKPIDASRASDPFETVVAGVAKMIDDAPVETPIEPIIGDATFTGEVPEAARARIEIRRALDAEAEARAVVAAVREAIERGVATDAIAIAVPRPSERVRAAMERCFEDAGLDVHFAGPRPEGAFAQVVFALLEVGAVLERHTVAEIVRSRVIDATVATGIEDVRAARTALRDLADTLERTATAEVEDDAIERLVATATAAPSSKREQRGAIARRLGEAFASVAEPGTRAEHARRARSLLARLGVAARAGGAVRSALARDDVRPRIARAEIDAYARDARLLEAIAAALDDLDRAGIALGPAESCTAQTFVHELRRALRIRGAGGGARAGAIRATGLEQLAGEPLSLLVVIDANDGVLPARNAGAGVLTPALELTLSVGTMDAPRSLVELAAAIRRSDRIVVCHRTTDDDGAALAPSPLVSWLERGGVRAELFHSAPLMGAPVTERERALALVAVAPDRADRLAPYAVRVAARERIRESLHAGAPRELGALDATEDVRALIEMETGGGARPLAVTALERIARCPFQGFAAQLYGALDDDPRTDDAPDRREEGILAHEALGAAFTAAARLWPVRPRDRAAITDVARAASNAVLARSGGALVRASLERIQLEVDRIVSLAIDDEEWDFAYSERGFGNAGDEWPALLLEDIRGRVALRGRIDRLDVSAKQNVAISNDVTPGAVRAVDYKRRVSLPAIAELGASAIQVPLYAIVARRGLGVTDARGRYLSTISPARNATSSFDDRFEALVEEDSTGSSEATRAALDRVHTLRAGDVAPVPTAAKWCAACGLDGACRRPRFAVTMIGREEQE